MLRRKSFDLEKEGSTKPIFNFISVSMNSFSCFQSVSFVSFLKTGFVHRYFLDIQILLLSFPVRRTTHNSKHCHRECNSNSNPSLQKASERKPRCDFPLWNFVRCSWRTIRSIGNWTLSTNPSNSWYLSCSWRRFFSIFAQKTDFSSILKSTNLSVELSIVEYFRGSPVLATEIVPKCV